MAEECGRHERPPAPRHAWLKSARRELTLPQHGPVMFERVDYGAVQHPRLATQNATQNFSDAETPTVRGVSV
jgi:hypothetical protein